MHILSKRIPWHYPWSPFIYYVSTISGFSDSLYSYVSIVNVVKFIYSEKATKFCKIFPLLLTTVHTVKSKGKISQNFVAFSEYMNFICTCSNLVVIGEINV